MANRRLIIIVTCCLTVMIGAAILIGHEWYAFAYQPITVGSDESVIIRIDKTTSAKHLTRMLYVQGWVRSIHLGMGWMRIQGLSHKLKAGIYQLQSGESAQHLIQRIVAGDVLRQPFLIKPGMTQQHIINCLKAAPFLTYREDDWQILDSFRQGNQAYEGLLLADTYSYDAGASAKDIIRQAHAHLQVALQQAWQSRNAALPYRSPYELLIAASIIEKESALPSERRLISGVIVNRLHKNMPLQMDPTVIYALGSAYQGSLTHVQLGVDSGYNTYRYRGLPPTPIATVGKDALNAASDPDIHAYLYFVAKGDGGHVFSVNYAAHREAIQRYMRKRQ